VGGDQHSKVHVIMVLRNTPVARGGATRRDASEGATTAHCFSRPREGVTHRIIHGGAVGAGCNVSTVVLYEIFEMASGVGRRAAGGGTVAVAPSITPTHQRQRQRQRQSMSYQTKQQPARSDRSIEFVRSVGPVRFCAYHSKAASHDETLSRVESAKRAKRNAKEKCVS
jgi:hypothetical protein